MIKKLSVFILSIAVLFGSSVFAEEASKFDVPVRSAVLVDMSKGEILYSKNQNEKLAPASVTKIMTMLLIMEEIDAGRLSFDDIVVASDRAKSFGGSTIFLETGEKMSVHELLKGIAVASGNDACVAMAEHISGTVDAFVELMNKKASQLGMINTQFKNCNGLDEDGHYTTAYDISLMSRELLKHKAIMNYTTIWIDSLRNGAFGLANTNKLIRFYDGATGLKTGSTSIAKYCLSASAKRGDTELIAVVMAGETSDERFNAARTLLDYGFANFVMKKGLPTGEVVGQIKVLKGKVDTVDVVVGGNFELLMQKQKAFEIKNNIIMDETVTAPFNAGEKVGIIQYFMGEEMIGESYLVAKDQVEMLSIWGNFVRMMGKVIGR